MQLLEFNFPSRPVSRSFAVFLWPFYMHFMLLLLSCRFTFSSFPSPFEFNGSESYLEMAVVMRFLKPPIMSKCVSSIKSEFRLSPLFVLFRWNAIGIKEDCSSDIQLFFAVFFLSPFLLFLWQNPVLIYTSFWVIKARGLQWIQVYSSHGNSGNTLKLSPHTGQADSFEMSALKDLRSALPCQ